MKLLLMIVLASSVFLIFQFTLALNMAATNKGNTAHANLFMVLTFGFFGLAIYFVALLTHTKPLWLRITVFFLLYMQGRILYTTIGKVFLGKGEK